eukprot:gene10689-3310_t
MKAILICCFFLFTNAVFFDSNNVKPTPKSNFLVYFSVEKPFLIEEGFVEIHLDVISKIKRPKKEITLQVIDTSLKFISPVTRIISSKEFTKKSHYKVSLDISLPVLPNFEITDTPHYLYVKIMNEEFKFPVKMEWFPLFIDEKFEKLFGCSLKKINTLLIGIQGSGKSSCVNTQKSSISNEICEPAVVMKNDVHVTREFQEYGFKHISRTSLAFHDGFGLDKETYHDEILYCLLHGKLDSSNFTVDAAKEYVKNPIGPLCSHKKLTTLNELRSEIHTVILFLTFEQIKDFDKNKDEDSNILMKRKLIIEKYNMMVLAQYEGDSNVSEDELLQQQEIIRNKVFTYLGISKLNVFLYLAYGNKKTEKDIFIDRNAAFIRDRLKKNAFTYLERQKELLKITELNLFWDQPLCYIFEYIIPKLSHFLGYIPQVVTNNVYSWVMKYFSK